MFFKKLTIEELIDPTNFSTSALRDEVKILIIDDEEFRYLDLLKRHDFRVTHVTDIEDISQTEAYGIILCDIKGVGKKFESKYEGAHLIDEIRKKYPLKIIFGYTGHQFDADFNQYFSKCDNMLKKDIDSDDWIENLDAAISKCADPVEQWKKIRSLLCESNIATNTIAAIEHDFVKFKQNKTPNFPSSPTLKKLPPEIKDLLIALTANSIFKILVG